MASIIVHHLERSRSHRVLWLLEELELPYELKHYKRDPETIRAPPELLKIHPLGKSPVVSIDDEVVAESGAILEELVALGDGRFKPKPGTAEARRYRFYLHYAEGSLMPPLLVRLIFEKLKSAPLPFFVRPIVKQIVKKVDETFTEPELQRHVAFLAAELGDRPFFTGDQLTAADIQMSYPIVAGRNRTSVDRHPNLVSFIERVQARPAYQRAVERGGPITFE